MVNGQIRFSWILTPAFQENRSSVRCSERSVNNNSGNFRQKLSGSTTALKWVRDGKLGLQKEFQGSFFSLTIKGWSQLCERRGQRSAQFLMMHQLVFVIIDKVSQSLNQDQVWSQWNFNNFELLDLQVKSELSIQISFSSQLLGKKVLNKSERWLLKNK